VAQEGGNISREKMFSPEQKKDTVLFFRSANPLIYGSRNASFFGKRPSKYPDGSFSSSPSKIRGDDIPYRRPATTTL